MRYFNGFSLRGEAHFFDAFLVRNEMSVAGFSYGAQQALEYVYNTPTRIDRLILISPAFFQTQTEQFIRTQLHYFQKDREAYTTMFLKNVAYPSKLSLSPYLQEGSKEELEALLRYVWYEEKLRVIQDKGTVIEVFLGEKDKIIPSQEAFDFFKKRATTYWIKEAGHLLS